MVCGICGVCFWTILLLSGYSYALRFVSLFPSRVCDSCFYSWCAIRHWTFGSHIFYLLVMILGFGLCKFLKSLSSSSSSVSVCVLLCVSFFSDLLLRSVSVPWIIFYPFTLKVRFLLLFLSVLPPTSLNGFTCVSFLTCLPYPVNFQCIWCPVLPLFFIISPACQQSGTPHLACFIFDFCLLGFVNSAFTLPAVSLHFSPLVMWNLTECLYLSNSFRQFRH